MYQPLNLMDPIPPTQPTFQGISQLYFFDFVIYLSWNCSSDLTLLYFSDFPMCISWDLSAVFLWLCRWLAWLLKPVAAGGSAAQRQFGGKTLPGGNPAQHCLNLFSAFKYFSDFVICIFCNFFASCPKPNFTFLQIFPKSFVFKFSFFLHRN